MAHVQTHYRPGESVTGKASADITAGTFVKVNGAWGDRRNPDIAPAGAGDTPFGFVRRDTKSGDIVAVDRGRWIVDLAANGNVAAGKDVVVAAGGKVSAAAADNTALVVGTAVAPAAGGYVTVAVK